MPRLFGLVGLVFIALISGFFYAWICSTMWGLDQLDPRLAIEAMNAMNVSVRNAVFFPAFFLTPVVLTIAAGVMWWSGARMAAFLFFGGAVVYMLGAMAPTAMVNVPMNRALEATAIPQSREEAAMIWSAYSERWQMWNIARTLASTLALVLCGFGLTRLSRASAV